MFRDKIIEIFVRVDDFCREITPMMDQRCSKTEVLANGTINMVCVKAS